MMLILCCTVSDTGLPCVTWWPPCSTVCGPLPHCCCSSSCSSLSLPCWECKCLVASSTSIIRRTSHDTTLTHSGSRCLLCSRYRKIDRIHINKHMSFRRKRIGQGINCDNVLIPCRSMHKMTTHIHTIQITIKVNWILGIRKKLCDFRSTEGQ